MTISIRLSEELVNRARVNAATHNRSAAQQIEHWAKIGRIAEDNADMTFSMISEILLAKSAIDSGERVKYVRRKDRK